MRPKPFLLLILDGWGHRPETQDNAIAQTATPVWTQLLEHAPHTLLDASGLSVGLPAGQIGNSEVGHMNLGAGRTIYQHLTRISHAIETGEFEQNAMLLKAIDQAARTGAAIHLMGLISPGGVHSHEDHIHATIDLCVARGAKRMYCHAFLDGRDVLPKSAEPSLAALETHLGAVGGKMASIVGRYFAMDRDNRWDRVEKAYRLITEGEASFNAPDALSAIAAAYQRGETDEFVSPTRIGEAPVHIQSGDVILFLNFRSDRARQLSHAFVTPDFSGFKRSAHLQLGAFVTLTEYDKTLKTEIAFPPESYSNTLGEYLSKLGFKQLRLAETEKYAHVTFFFNCGIENPFAGEERALVPSPKIATYDLKPEMSAPQVTEALVQAILNQQYDVIICNYANPDMVGHTGDFKAAQKAVGIIDQSLSSIIDALNKVGGEALITADHGNIECMRDPASGQPHTAHTLSPVPLVYVGKQLIQFKSGGTLKDVAPTLLQLLGLQKPEEMTGQALIR
ncbi:MAG: 2,3-bisphosphoglycerate-independent phosphoglycerate mutase [Gammaproteobacteria bacterium]